jgi:hypothetical protein
MKEAEILNVNTRLKNMSLSNNMLRYEEICSLTEGLIQNNYLVGDEGAGHIARPLKENSSLVHINLRSSGIFKSGARMIADALKFNSFLQRNEICGNNFGTEGYLAFAEALEYNFSVLHITAYLCVEQEFLNDLRSRLKTNNIEFDKERMLNLLRLPMHSNDSL